MKKEYFLLIVAIIALSAYLFFYNTDQDNYLLPEIAKIDESKIESIEIIKNKETIKCFKDSNKWVVTEEKFLGNSRIIQELVASIKDLTITTLISEKGNLKRYDLDDEKKIKVIARGKNGVLRKFCIGKTTSTQKHTFITLNDKKDVFHANSNLKSMFNKSIDSLRDKQVQKFDSATIKSIEISKGDFKRIISKKELAEDNTKQTPQWESQDNAELKQEPINSLIETLSDLRCSSYAETQTKTNFENKTPFLKITLKAEKIFKFTLFPKTEKDKYPGISSQNKYLFLLQDYTADDIISHTDKLLNIKSESANEENS